MPDHTERVRLLLGAAQARGTGPQGRRGRASRLLAVIPGRKALDLNMMNRLISQNSDSSKALSQENDTDFHSRPRTFQGLPSSRLLTHLQLLLPCPPSGTSATGREQHRAALYAQVPCSLLCAQLSSSPSSGLSAGSTGPVSFLRHHQRQRDLPSARSRLSLRWDVNTQHHQNLPERICGDQIPSMGS